MAFQSLDFVYHPSRDVRRDVAYFTDVLGGRLRFAVEGMGARVDAPPGCLSLRVAHTFDLIEAGDRVANVTGIIERLLAFLGKCKGLRRHPILLPSTEPRRFLRHPGTPSSGALHRPRALDVLSGCRLLLLGGHALPPSPRSFTPERLAM